MRLGIHAGGLAPLRLGIHAGVLAPFRLGIRAGGLAPLRLGIHAGGLAPFRLGMTCMRFEVWVLSVVARAARHWYWDGLDVAVRNAGGLVPYRLD